MHSYEEKGKSASSGISNSIRPRMNDLMSNEIEEEEENQEGQESASVKALRNPEDPTKEEWEQHMMTHVPFRNWCPHCVRGRAVSQGHFRNKKDDKAIPTIGIDYMYMKPRKEGEASREEYTDGDEAGMPILVIKDENTKRISAHVVPEKGRNAHAVKVLRHEIEILGYKKMILKSDQEPAIMALKESVKRERDEDIVMEESPVGESASNGSIENAVRNVQGQVRSMRDALETRYQIKINGESSCIPWMVRHAANLISRYQVGMDGRTAYERWKGKKYKQGIA